MEKATLTIPAGYQPILDILDTERAIKLIKDTFERNLAEALHLVRVSAPLFVNAQSGINDNLNGVERPVEFDIPATGEDVQIVQSLAKWKRLALKRYGITTGHGLYTDMNAIRRDEELDNIHSVYVDQWDWEMVMDAADRNVAFLQEIVRKIVGALRATEQVLCAKYTAMTPFIQDVTFVTAQELEDKYPQLTPKEREDMVTKEYGTVFVMGIGAPLAGGKSHDGRAPDYDDWSLNGDILVWNPVLEHSLEISSMGIRVSPEVLDKQLTAAGCDDRRILPFHSQLLAGQLPLTTGGGIGQSRLCMLLLQKAHIGEVQASLWPAEMMAACEKADIRLL